MTAGGMLNEIAGWLHRGRTGRRLLGVLEAYIDESSSATFPTVPRLYVVAGWLGEATAWHALETEWRRILGKARPRVTEFKASDCANLRGEFKQFSRRRATRLTLELGEAISKADIRGVASLGIIAAPLRKHMDYTFCFGPCFFHLTWLADTYATSERVAYMIDEKSKVFDHIKGVNDFLRKVRRGEYAKRIGPWGFADSKEFVPLQVADYLAYETLQSALRIMHKVERPLEVDRKQAALIRPKIAATRIMHWNGRLSYFVKGQGWRYGTPPAS